MLNPNSVDIIRGHFCPDLDVYGSVALIRIFGDNVFGDKLPKVEFVPAGEELPGKERCLTLDTGGKFQPEKLRYDHHNEGNGERCTMDLIAKELGINSDQHPGVKLVLEAIRRQDLEGTDIYNGGSFDAGHVAVSIKSLVDCTYIFKSQLLRNGNQPCSDQESFWLLEIAMEAIIVAAINIEQFTENGPWKDNLIKAHYRLYEELYSEEINGLRLSEPEDILRAEGIKKNLDFHKTIQFFLSHERWFKKNGNWQPNKALFSICGIAFGLGYFYSDEEQLISAIVKYLKNFKIQDSDWSQAVDDAGNWQDNRSRLIAFQNRTGKERIVINAVKSNAMKITAAARHAMGVKEHKANLAIVKRSYDQIQLFVAGRDFHKKLLQKLGIALRIAECLAQKREFLSPELEMLGRSGRVPEWYMASDKNGMTFMVSNRTIKCPSPPKTVLTMATILRLAQNIFYFGEIPSEKVIKAIVEIGQKENGWPKDRKRPWLFKDIRKPQNVELESRRD